MNRNLQKKKDKNSHEYEIHLLKYQYSLCKIYKIEDYNQTVYKTKYTK